MKRNHPPNNAEELSEEQKIINDSLRELFAKSSGAPRQVLASSKGFWINDKRHVKVESTKGLPVHLVRYSRDLKYEYLNAFEALYCLECNQLLIIYNDLPLSLAEAYNILLTEESSRNYRVFQHLNRSGYICLEPAIVDLTIEAVSSDQKLMQQSEPASSVHLGNNVPLFNLDDSMPGLSFKDVLSRLRSVGPQELDEKTVGHSSTANDFKYTFDVYKRETYAKNKPCRNKRSGRPDYNLLVYDHEPSHKPPDCKQLIGYSKHSSAKLLIALIDSDYTICYTQFTPITALDLALC